MRKFITFTAASLLIASAFGAGEVYRWRGADGTWHYSDQPRPGAELIRSGIPRPATVTADQAPAADAAPEPVVEADLPVSDAVAAEVRASADAEKAAQCKQANDAYNEAIKARRIYKVDAAGKQVLDADGKPVFMNNAEIDAERLRVRGIRDLACGPGA